MNPALKRAPYYHISQKEQLLERDEAYTSRSPNSNALSKLPDGGGNHDTPEYVRGRDSEFPARINGRIRDKDVFEAGLCGCDIVSIVFVLVDLGGGESLDASWTGSHSP